MNPASRIPKSTDTNPCSVLRSISSQQGQDLDQASFGPTTEFVPEFGPIAELTAEGRIQESGSHDPEPPALNSAEQHIEEKRYAEVVALRINPETAPAGDSHRGDPLEGAADSASQIQQLSARLEASFIELGHREVEHESRVTQWNQTALQHQTELEFRDQQLQQQASQVRCQQLHLMQLQTDIVKSHEATREAIETLLGESADDVSAVAAIRTLAYQLGGRFDYITRRWEHLTELMASANAQIVASQSVDDRVDWSGEFT